MVAILLSTYNGEQFLKEQLLSLFNQTYQDFILIARDDGSSDKSLEILKEFKQNYPSQIIILEENENLGVKKSFSKLLEYSINHTSSEYFMFCDQDDVWSKEKIEVSLKKLKEIEKGDKALPCLVHTDLELVDEKLKPLFPSFWRYEKINPKLNSFNRLLLQNTITGCTTIFNRSLALKVGSIPQEAIMHDWWIGLVASKFGKIAYLPCSTLKYRQHQSNNIGAKGYRVEFFKNVGAVLAGFLFRTGRFYKHHKINLIQAKKFLDIYEKELDELTKTMLQDFSYLEEKSFLEKREILIKHKLLKQGIIRNVGMFLSV